MTTLDVGGGFCSDIFESMACVLSQALDDYFPSPNIRIIGEPGRYYVASAFSLACNVIARRTIEDAATQTPAYMLYLNDGIYGNFTCIMFDHQHPVPRVLRCGKRFLHGSEASERGTGPITEYSIWGQTCDGLDLIAEKAEFSEVLDVGDWLYFEEMGGSLSPAMLSVLLIRGEFLLSTLVWIAYTRCSATRFNGFTDNHEVVYISSEPGVTALLASIRQMEEEWTGDPSRGACKTKQ
jgi:ornithine decarboxylase